MINIYYMKIFTTLFKKIIEYVILFFVVYIAISLYVYKNQNSLLYFPSANVKLDYNWKQIKNKENDTVLGYELNKGFKKSVVLFHGNTGAAADRTYYEDIFRNVNLIIAEYPGFGANIHQNPNKELILKNANSLIERIKEIKRLNNLNNLIIAGESLGTGIAAKVASNYETKKLMLFTPYSSIEEVAQERYSFLPVKFLLKDNFTTIEPLKNFNGKTFIITSGKDNVINPRFAQKLVHSLEEKNKEVINIFVPAAGHTNWWVYMDNKQKELFHKFVNG